MSSHGGSEPGSPSHSLKTASDAQLKQLLQSLDDYDFEHLVGDLWEQMGWNTSVSQASNDAGIDVTATKTSPYPQKKLIQAKRYGPNTTVGSPAIQQYASLKHQERGVDSAVIVTTNDFSRQGRNIAQELNVKLVNGDGLVDIIRRLDAYEQVARYTRSITNPTTANDQSNKDSVPYDFLSDTHALNTLRSNEDLNLDAPSLDKYVFSKAENIRPEQTQLIDSGFSSPSFLWKNIGQRLAVGSSIIEIQEFGRKAIAGGTVVLFLSFVFSALGLDMLGALALLVGWLVVPLLIIVDHQVLRAHPLGWRGDYIGMKRYALSSWLIPGVGLIAAPIYLYMRRRKLASRWDSN